jgi:poly(A) polymerase
LTLGAGPGILTTEMDRTIAGKLESLGRVYDRLLELASGRRLYLVGGTLRDIELGRDPSDFDFAVSGSGLEFAQSFARKIHGTLVILSRPDDEARVVYHRETVFDFNGFGDRAIEDDLARRDFTVNALAAEVTHGSVGPVLDPFKGRTDLDQAVIRPVSARSLESDPLRLLRAFRLALELGFSVDAEVYEQGRAVSLRPVAGERIGAELLRIMETPYSYPCMVKLAELGRLEEILPGVAPLLADADLRRHSLQTYFKLEELIHQPGFFNRFEPEWDRYFNRWGVEAIDNLQSPVDDRPEPVAPDPSPMTHDVPPAPLPYRRALLKLAGLVHDVAKPETRFINADGETHFYGHDALGSRAVARMCRDRLRLSRDQTDMLSSLVAEHMRLHLLATAPDLSDRAVRRYFRDLGEEAFGLMMLCYADGWATAGRTTHLEDTVIRMIDQKRAEDAQEQVERLVNGDDLIALGMKPGPSFKVILQELEDLQLEGRIATKEAGIEYLKTHLTGLSAGNAK